MFSDVHASGSDEKYTGDAVINYSEKSGFTVETKFSGDSVVRKLVGEYVPAKNVYNFYPATNKAGETVTGVIRSNVRVEMRASGSNLVVIETCTMLDGKEGRMQFYRLTRQ